MRIILILDLWRKSRHNYSFGLEVGNELVLQVNEVRVAFINFPRLSVLRAAEISRRQGRRVRWTGWIRFMVVAFTLFIEDSNLEFNVIAYV